mmetsp:Transcript_43727/g.79817  ORF Transcript_43727/g.79817 Transcript_43727/m.79817 type:complete len:516 (-) Transcript_43727:78-1625(-)
MAPKAVELTPVQRLRAFQKSGPANKKCFVCAEIALDVCMDFGTFLCQKCAGIHRSFGHKIKSISLSEWSLRDVEGIEGLGGNARLASIWLGKFNASSDTGLTDAENPEKVREYLRDIFVEKKWFTANPAAPVATPQAALPTPAPAAVASVAATVPAAAPAPAPAPAPAAVAPATAATAANVAKAATVCEGCGAHLPDDAAFCGKCGRKRPEPPPPPPRELASHCTECGAAFHEDALFCGQCGAKRKELEPAAQPKQVPDTVARANVQAASPASSPQPPVDLMSVDLMDTPAPTVAAAAPTINTGVADAFNPSSAPAPATAASALLTLDASAFQGGNVGASPSANVPVAAPTESTSSSSSAMPAGLEGLVFPSAQSDGGASGDKKEDEVAKLLQLYSDPEKAVRDAFALEASRAKPNMPFGGAIPGSGAAALGQFSGLTASQLQQLDAQSLLQLQHMVVHVLRQRQAGGSPGDSKVPTPPTSPLRQEQQFGELLSVFQEKNPIRGAENIGSATNQM